MAQVKNSFIKSKMNQDLDDRLIPNGEYREAFNVSVNKSMQNLLEINNLPINQYSFHF